MNRSRRTRSRHQQRSAFSARLPGRAVSLASPAKAAKASAVRLLIQRAAFRVLATRIEQRTHPCRHSHYPAAARVLRALSTSVYLRQVAHQYPKGAGCAQLCSRRHWGICRVLSAGGAEPLFSLDRRSERIRRADRTDATPSLVRRLTKARSPTSSASGGWGTAGSASAQRLTMKETADSSGSGARASGAADIGSCGMFMTYPPRQHWRSIEPRVSRRAASKKVHPAQLRELRTGTSIAVLLRDAETCRWLAHSETHIATRAGP